MTKQKIDFVKLEEDMHRLWEDNKAFERSEELSEGRPEYVFYDGPPFATGLPHYGHILSGTIKDTITRFYYMQGFRVERRFGWDCHGLPVEYEIDKALGITSSQDVLRMGIWKYNEECRKIVLKYTREWEKIVKRMGRWIDFNNGYKTMDMCFMESVWNIFKMLFEKNSVYMGHRVMPYSTACSTPLSNFEANQNYKEVSDPSVLVSFPLKLLFKGFRVSLAAWTTTPWTLVSNLALLINKRFEYAVFDLEGSFFVMHKEKVGTYFESPKVLAVVSGEELLGLEYDQPFEYFENYRKRGFFKVYHADFVVEDNGTGIVHCSPGHGEDDYKAMVKLGLIQENEVVPSPLDEKGRFDEEIREYAGVYFKDADDRILERLKDRILVNGRATHRYPFCWRSDTPLVYKLVPNWFIKVKRERSGLLETNNTVNWVPESVKDKKFKNWLENAKDWSISRNRFWGTPIPLWHCGDDYICVGSVSELEELTGKKVRDIHRESIDDLVIKKDGREYRRISEVFDCWFESGSMPYAQQHWPFRSRSLRHPADFIAEGIDQTRGWFYTLHVISTILFKKAAFKNCVVSGIVLASDKRKMSKRLKNYTDPSIVIDRYGADSLRLYLISSPVVTAESMCFSEEGVGEVLKNLIIPWYNSLQFYKECLHGDDKTEMDDWVLWTLNSFGCRVEGDMKRYLLSNIMNYSVGFIEDLCNWYIRINRKALRYGATEILRDVLVKFSIVMAPFTPFFSEYSYQCIARSGCKEFRSVHHEMFPAFENVKDHSFNKAKSVIEAVRKMRELRGLSLKTPLKGTKVVCDERFLETAATYSEIIKSECFILDLEFLNERCFESKISFKPNFSEIRKECDKQKIKTKIRLIKEASDNELVNLVENNLKIQKDGVEVSKSDVIYKREFVCDGYGLNFEDFFVILDIEKTSEVVEMKTAREFFSFIQKLRKRSGLKMSDSVSICTSSLMEKLVKKYYSLSFCEWRSDYVAKEAFKHNGNDVEVFLYLI